MKPPRSTENELILGLVSVSDRASQGIYEDEGIPSLEAWCKKAITNPIKIHKRLIPDEQFHIEKTLRELVDIIGCDLILTTGGTGPARRDVTPEATLAVATREMPGFGEQMRAISGHFVPTAILSRQVAVLRETPDHAALIINLPGRPKAIAETLEGLKDESGKSIVNGIFAAVPYCIDLIGGPYIETREDVIKAFRPKNAIKPKANAPKETPADVKPTTQPEPVAQPTVTSEASSVAPNATPTPKATGVSSTTTPHSATEKPSSPKDPRETDPSFGTKAALDDVLVVRPRTATSLLPEKVLIWLHGMGVDNTDFASFADDIVSFGGPDCQVYLPNAPKRVLTRHPQFPLRAWFDIRGDQIDDKEDLLGLETSSRRVLSLIAYLEKVGVNRQNIYLGGFSQGAAVSLFTGVRLERPLGGIIAFSGYVPFARNVPLIMTQAAQQTPFFMAHGNFDSVISPLIAERGARVIAESHPNFAFELYDMDHGLCPEEMHHLAQFLSQ